MGGTHQKVDEILTILQQRSISVVAVAETPVVVGPSAAPTAPVAPNHLMRLLTDIQNWGRSASASPPPHSDILG